MYLKKKLLNVSAILCYVFTALWIVTAACFFALSNNLYWMFFAFALVSLVDGFVLRSVADQIDGTDLPRKLQIELLVAWIASIVCPPAFVCAAIAYFRKKQDDFPSPEKERPVSQPSPQGNKRFYRSRCFIVMCAALGAVLLFSFCGMCFETVGFSVKVTDGTLTSEMTHAYNDGKINGEEFTFDGDTTYSYTMYKPNTATEETPAPVVFVLPGFTRTKATMTQYALEFARRGAVAFTLDPGGQGSTTEPSTNGANGIEYLVQYVYNNTDDFKFCDKNNFGAMGHSAGGGNITTLAQDMAGEVFRRTDENDKRVESVIKAIYISGYIKQSSANRYKNFRCNAAMSYANYDEGSFRYQSDDESFEVVSLRFINEVNGENNGYTTVEYDHDYGSMADGTYRVVHREKINHCFEMYDATSIANTIDFFDVALGLDSGIGGGNQIWFGKEFFNGLALAAAFAFVIGLCGVLMMTPIFSSLKRKQTESVGETGEILSSPTVQSAPQSVAHKVIFWLCMITTAVIACLDYIPLANLSIQIFPTHDSASVYTFTFPARMVNAILLWAAINGAIGLVLFFGTTAIENLYEFIKFKVTGKTPNYDWNKFKEIKIGGNKWYGVLFNVLKTILMAFVMFGAFYFLLQICYWCFHQDFRFMLVSASPLNARMFVTALEYMPIIFVFYISNSIRVNCSIAREGWKEWKVMLVSALANSIGLAFILLINYVCFFATGAPYYGYWGNHQEIWLFVNMVFGLVVMMFILPIFNRISYKQTGNVWTGAIAWCMIFIMMTVSASVSYIPM